METIISPGVASAAQSAAGQPPKRPREVSTSEQHSKRARTGQRSSSSTEPRPGLLAGVLQSPFQESRPSSSNAGLYIDTAAARSAVGLSASVGTSSSPLSSVSGHGSIQSQNSMLPAVSTIARSGHGMPRSTPAPVARQGSAALGATPSSSTRPHSSPVLSSGSVRSTRSLDNRDMRIAQMCSIVDGIEATLSASGTNAHKSAGFSGLRDRDIKAHDTTETLKNRRYVCCFGLCTMKGTFILRDYIAFVADIRANRRLA